MGVSSSAVASEVELLEGPPPSANLLAEKLFAAEPGIARTRSVYIDSKRVVPKAVGMLIQFDLNSAVIRPESKAHLDSVGQMMRLERVLEKKLRVEGHADASGEAGHNQELSQRRAEAVAQYLVRSHQINPDRLTVVGRGEAQPLQNRNPYDAKNRRVQFRALN